MGCLQNMKLYTLLFKYFDFDSQVIYIPKFKK